MQAPKVKPIPEAGDLIRRAMGQAEALREAAASTEGSSANEDTERRESVRRAAFLEDCKRRIPTDEIANGIFNIPLRYRGKQLETIRPEYRVKVERGLKAILNGRSLYLFGKPGGCKTHLAVALTYEWAKQQMTMQNTPEGYRAVYGKKAKFLSVMDLLMELKQSFNDKGESEMEILTRHSRNDLLIVDDLGAERQSEWTRQTLFYLFDHAYRSERQLIVTSNLSLDEISQTVDDRIASRLIEIATAIHLDGEDYRVMIGEQQHGRP